MKVTTTIKVNNTKRISPGDKFPKVEIVPSDSVFRLMVAFLFRTKRPTKEILIRYKVLEVLDSTTLLVEKDSIV